MLAWKNVSRGLALLMLFVPVGAFRPVNAAQNEVTLDSDITLNDAASCSAIGGSWADNVCTLEADSRLGINKGRTLTILKGVRLTNSGAFIDNLGTITNEADGFIANEADGYIYNEADSIITNHGTIINRSASTISNLGIIANEADGSIYNFGTFGDSTILNVGTIENAGFIANDSGTIRTGGIILNAGTIDNSGIIDNRNDSDLSGTITNQAGGIILNSGTITGDGSGTIDNHGAISNSGAIGGNIQSRPPATKEIMCNMLDAFITQVNAAGNGLTSEQVQQLLANTNQSKIVLECP